MKRAVFFLLMAGLCSIRAQMLILTGPNDPNLAAIETGQTKNYHLFPELSADPMVPEEKSGAACVRQPVPEVTSSAASVRNGPPGPDRWGNPYGSGSAQGITTSDVVESRMMALMFPPPFYRSLCTAGSTLLGDSALRLRINPARVEPSVFKPHHPIVGSVMSADTNQVHVEIGPLTDSDLSSPLIDAEDIDWAFQQHPETFLPHFSANVFVSPIAGQPQTIIPEPSTFALALLGLLTSRAVAARNRSKGRLAPPA